MNLISCSYKLVNSCSLIKEESLPNFPWLFCIIDFLATEFNTNNANKVIGLKVQTQFMVNYPCNVTVQ